MDIESGSAHPTGTGPRTRRAAWSAGLLTTALAAGLLTGAPAHAIAVGSPAPDGAYRFVAKVEVGTARGCTGALVAPQWIATAASCFAEGGQPVPAGPPKQETMVTVGRTDLQSTGGHGFKVTDLVPHADRNLVLAKLAGRIDDIDPIEIAAAPPVAGETLKIAGYGRTHDEWVPDRLHTAPFAVQNVGATTLDVLSPSGAGICKGDSGGPAFRDANGRVELVAINNTAWQGGCYKESETRRDATETRTDGLTDWVRLSTGVLDKRETIVGTGDWDKDGHPDVFARDPSGDLYLFPGSGRTYGERVRIGSGWSEYTIAGITDWDNDGNADIIARYNGNGELWLYPGEGKRSFSSQERVRIGVGWVPYTFAGVADFDRDGKADVVAREESSGILWLYPGSGKRAPNVDNPNRFQIGDGWGGWRFFGVIDRTGDGNPDIIGQYNNDGYLWLYPGSGKRAPYPGTPYRYQMGVGWGGYLGFMTPDVDGDGAVDLVAKQPGLDDWVLYPGVVGTGYGGARWTAATVRR
jgi:hypothetical protein